MTPDQTEQKNQGDKAFKKISQNTFTLQSDKFPSFIEPYELFEEKMSSDTNLLRYIIVLTPKFIKIIRMHKTFKENVMQMQKRFDGQILNGNLDCESNELEVTSIKNIPTQSVWLGRQITKMLDQTEKAIELNMGLAVTVRDSIPLILEHEEIVKLNSDINKIQSILDSKD